MPYLQDPWREEEGRVRGTIQGNQRQQCQHTLGNLMTSLHWRVSYVIDIYCHTTEI